MKINKVLILFLLICIAFSTAYAQSSKKSLIKLARVKYSGGGDWYNDQSSEVNLLNFVAKNTNIPVDPTYEFVDLASDNIFSYPLLFLTGHGTIQFTETEIRNLRSYLENGGFLYIDDDYGLDKSVHEEMKKVMPSDNFVELPFSHPIYHCLFKFPNGLPKIHEHDGKAPQGFGIFYKQKLCVFYTYECNLADGWADPDVHKDTPEKREASLKMGANIIVYALTDFAN